MNPFRKRGPTWPVTVYSTGSDVGRKEYGRVGQMEKGRLYKEH